MRVRPRRWREAHDKRAWQRVRKKQAELEQAVGRADASYATAITLLLSHSTQRGWLRTKEARAHLAYLGVHGGLAAWLNPPADAGVYAQMVAGNLRHAFTRLGWSGVQLELVKALRQEQLMGGVGGQSAMVEAILFSEHGWTLAECDYARPHGVFAGPHWYLRPPAGRPPGACPEVRDEARRARWKQSPAYRKMLAERRAQAARRTHRRTRTQTRGRAPIPRGGGRRD